MDKMPIEIYCPECWARPGERCRDLSGELLSSVHADRWEKQRPAPDVLFDRDPFLFGS